MKSLSNTRDLEKARNTLNTKIKNINFENSSNTEISNKFRATLMPEKIKPHMEVFVTNLGKNGTVLSHVSKSNEVQVQIGSLKMNVNIKYLQPANNSNVNAKNNISAVKNLGYTNISKSKTAKTEVNVIGLNVEEAIFVVDKFLDDSALSKLQSVRIVHGKGTGKLRNGIHQFLKTNPHVKSFRIGSFGEGEMGVTIVELR